MKKIYLFLASIAISFGAMAQTKNFWIDYNVSDSIAQVGAGGVYTRNPDPSLSFSIPRPMHMRYTSNLCQTMKQSVTQFCVVAFSDLVDMDTPYTNAQSLSIDSITTVIAHRNNSGLDDTLTLKIIDVDNNGYPDVDGTPLKVYTIIGKNFVASKSVMDALPLGWKIGFAVPKGKFAVRLEFTGDVKDSLVIQYGYGFPPAATCNGYKTEPSTFSTITSTAGGTFSANSFVMLLCKGAFSPTKTGVDKYFIDCDNNQIFDAAVDGAAPTQNIAIRAKVSFTVGVEENKAAGLKLYQNQPNPFNTTSVITYELAKQAKVSLEIYDITGRKLTTINEGDKNMGKHNITIEANKFAKGLYFYTLKVNEYSLTQRMIIAE